MATKSSTGANCENSSSIWNAYAHPILRNKQTNEFTKPDSEYFGTSNQQYAIRIDL